MENVRTKIDENMSIYDILSAYPFLLKTFKEYGLGKFEKSEILEKLGPLLKLKTPLKMMGINSDMFVDLLNKEVEDNEKDSSFVLADNPEKQKDLTLLALLPCGLKMPFSRAFDEFVEGYNEKHSENLKYLLEGNVNHELSYYEYIDSVNTLEELPDLIISSDINSFYHSSFKKRFLDTGSFVDLLPETINSDFQNVAYDDPDRQFTMLSSNLLVLVSIDSMLEGKPEISSWSDILKEEYTNSVVMRGQEEFFCNGVLLPFYALFGMDGIKQMGRSVRTGCHPSEMVKMIDSGKDDVAPLYIMPYFFAQKIKNKNKISIHIPKEGAIVSPVQMFVKKDALESVKDISEFILGKEFGQMCADAYFPSTNPEVTNLTDGIENLYWLGWDFLKSSDIEKVKKDIEEVFIKEFRETGGYV
jgi:ABC-type Fe3+ transport system substrate-binding protein